MAAVTKQWSSCPASERARLHPRSGKSPQIEGTISLRIPPLSSQTTPERTGKGRTRGGNAFLECVLFQILVLYVHIENSKL